MTLALLKSTGQLWCKISLSLGLSDALPWLAWGHAFLVSVPQKSRHLASRPSTRTWCWCLMAGDVPLVEFVFHSGSLPLPGWWFPDLHPGKTITLCGTQLCRFWQMRSRVPYHSHETVRCYFPVSDVAPLQCTPQSTQSASDLVSVVLL